MSVEQHVDRSELVRAYVAAFEKAEAASSVADEAAEAVCAFDVEHPHVCAAINRGIAEKRAAAKPRPEPVEDDAGGAT